MKKRIFLFTLFILLSGLKTEAFLGEDLGLNLYKEIDKGYYKLNYSQIDYELKGGDKIGDLTKNLNQQLEANGLKGCIKNISTSELREILSKEDTKKLYEKLDEKCKTENNEITISSLKKYISFLKTFNSNAKQRAKDKTKNIYEISKLGLYTDGDTKNSQFDLIADLQEIDKIIFGEEIKYNGEENNDFFDNFEENPFFNNIKKQNQNKKNDENNSSDKNKSKNKKNDENKENNKGDNKKDENINDESNNNLQSLLDGNNYVCPQNNDQSGLNNEELEKLKNDLNKGNYKYNFNTGLSGHLKLPDTNKIQIGTGFFNNLGINITPPIINIKGTYDLVNDNSVWECTPESFFCITIDFIIHKQKLLGYGKEKSIKNLLEVSNGHLKKAANTSLLQAKMGINNFENILRDLDFSEMFHMGVIISKKSPPILNLETQKEKKLAKENPKYKKILENLYKNQSLEYKRKNDLNLIMQKEAKLRELINSTGNSPTLVNTKERKRKLFLSNIKAENEYLTNHKINLINKGILQDFYNELVEYEKFIGGLYEYTESVFGNVKTLRDKPRGD